MEQHLKKRILGAFVTVLAIGIALPVILDGSRHEAEFLTDVPPMPELPEWAGVDDDRRVRIELQQLADGNSQNALEIPEPVVVTQDDPAPPRGQSDRSSLDEQKVPYVWTLQLGAFAEARNAYALRDQLRAKGYKAYTEEFPDSRLTRVYVGPEVQRASIEALQKKLQSELGQQDIHIKRYQPGR